MDLEPQNIFPFFLSLSNGLFEEAVDGHVKRQTDSERWGLYACMRRVEEVGGLRTCSIRCKC